MCYSHFELLYHIKLLVNVGFFVVGNAAVLWVIKSEGITGQLLAIPVIDEPSFIC